MFEESLFFDRPFTEKAPDQLLWPPLFSSLPFSCLFESNFTEKRGGWGIATLSHSFSATLSVVSRLARSRQTSTLWLMNRSGDMNLGDTRTNTLFSFEAHFFAVTGRSGLTYVMCEQRRQPAQSELKALNILRQVTGFNRPPKPPKWPRE